MIVQPVWVLISAICCVGKHKGHNYERGQHRVHLVWFIIIIIIIIIRYVCLLSQAFLPGTSLEPAVIPNAQASSFTLQYFPYYV